MVLKTKFLFLLVALTIALPALAEPTIQVHGRVSQIKDGNVELVSPSKTVRIPLKNLPKEMRKAITTAQANKQVLHLSLMPQMIAGR